MSKNWLDFQFSAYYSVTFIILNKYLAESNNQAI